MKLNASPKQEALRFGATMEIFAWAEILQKRQAYSPRLMTKNFRAKTGEIDLIYTESRSPTSRERVIVFVEVRARNNPGFARSEEFVDHRKVRRFRSTVEVFLASHWAIPDEIRMDLWTWNRGRWDWFPDWLD